MLIGGLQKMTLLDYPGKVAAVIFTVGCNFRCGFCHNPELVINQRSEVRGQRSEVRKREFDEKRILEFLKSRQGLLEAVVISGGEPMLQPDLPEFIKKIRELGFLVKVDTNGANPLMIEKLNQEKLVDYWAMDIKAPREKYEAVAGCPVDLEAVKKSAELIKNSGAPYEFRSTLVEGLHIPEDVLTMAREIEGAELFVLQKFVSRDKLVDSSFVGRQSFSNAELIRLVKECERWVKKCVVR